MWRSDQVARACRFGVERDAQPHEVFAATINALREFEALQRENYGPDCRLDLSEMRSDVFNYGQDFGIAAPLIRVSDETPILNSPESALDSSG